MARKNKWNDLIGQFKTLFDGRKSLVITEDQLKRILEEYDKFFM